MVSRMLFVCCTVWVTVGNFSRDNCKKFVVVFKVSEKKIETKKVKIREIKLKC